MKVLVTGSLGHIGSRVLPLMHPKFRNWMTGPVGRRTLVTYADLAGAMTAALEAEGPQFGAYTVVSDADGNVFDLTKGGVEIGWIPQNAIDEDGAVSCREDALTVLPVPDGAPTLRRSS